MSLDSLQALLIHELQDLYSAEQQFTTALPKLSDAASTPMLKKLFDAQLGQKRRQIDRLKIVFELLDTDAENVHCEGMAGLIQEGEELLKEPVDLQVRDAAIIATAQRMEHYEIAGYRTALTFAQRIGRNDVAELMQEALDEESTTERKLREVAIAEVNPLSV